MTRFLTRKVRLVFALFALSLLGGCGEGGTDPVLWTRFVALEGQSNFRDFGGYETTDGKTVKVGVVFRSGRLDGLTDEDVARVARVGVRTVVSFLTPDEIAVEGGDRLPEGVREVELPIESGDDLVLAVNEARRSGDFSKLPVTLNPEVHRLLVTQAAAQYAALYREIIKGENFPLVFHCSHGVHRTGTAAAILLWSLGVPWETVREDYLLSNKTRKAEVEVRLEALRKFAADKQGVTPEEVDMANARAFYVLEGRYIDATRDEILKLHGSIDSFLTEGLGLTREEVGSLREALLE